MQDLRLRPYKNLDAQSIADWLKDEYVYHMWKGERFGEFPLTAKMIDDMYSRRNGVCDEADNFYPFVLVDDGALAGHFIMRYTDGNPDWLRFGHVIVNDAIRITQGL
jgi:hypothetical protein